MFIYSIQSQCIQPKLYSFLFLSWLPQFSIVIPIWISETLLEYCNSIAQDTPRETQSSRQLTAMKDFFRFLFIFVFFFTFGVQQKDVTGPWERAALEAHAARGHKGLGGVSQIVRHRHVLTTDGWQCAARLKLNLSNTKATQSGQKDTAWSYRIESTVQHRRAHHYAMPCGTKIANVRAGCQQEIRARCEHQAADPHTYIYSYNIN